jgi:NADH-quinone oxidoreductase subunit H
MIGHMAAIPPDWPGGFWSHFGSFTGILLVFVLVMIIMLIYLERRVIGRFQSRLGPNRTGPFGLLQGIADAIKILIKETITPAKGDKWVYWLAPVVAFVPALLVFAVIPFKDGALMADLNIGILFVVAIGSVSVVGVFMAGWGSNNKYSLLGAMRSVAMVVSYEIPLGLAIVSVVLLAGSLSMNDIVTSQNIPFILFQPLGFLIFFLAASAEINRAPFDLLEAESELVAGFHTEYSGSKFVMFYMVEYFETLAIACIVTTLFLSGWRGPGLPPVLWFLIKVFVVFFVFMWVRSTVPRLRIDQIMGFAWKCLLPLALINLFITALQVVFWPEGLPWVMIFVNLAIMAVLILLWSKLFKLGGGRVEV